MLKPSYTFDSASKSSLKSKPYYYNISFKLIFVIIIIKEDDLLELVVVEVVDISFHPYNPK